MVRAQAKRVLPVAVFLLSASVGIYPASAQSEAPRDTRQQDVRDKYIEKLEARIKALEKEQARVSALEKKLDALSSQLAAKSSVEAAVRERSGPANGKQKQEPSPSDSVRTASAQATAPASSNGVTPSATADKPAERPPALAAQEDADALRDLQVVRDQAVTVKQGGLDVSLNARYTRATTQLQFSRAVMGTFGLRYGLFPGVEISASVPYYWSYRSTEFAPGTFEKNKITDWGDVGGQITATLFKETIDLPGLFAYASFTAPTGPDPYWIEPGQRPFAQPVNPLWLTQSAGHWSYTVGGTLVKTLEPIIVFGGLSYTRYVPEVYAGSKMQPGDRVGWSAGVGLAVSERTMLGTALTGTFVKDFVMDGTRRFGNAAETVNVAMSLTQRIAPGFFVEPSVTIGLTNDAPQAIVAIGVRKSFDPPSSATSSSSANTPSSAKP